jgi:hypothetical protein
MKPGVRDRDLFSKCSAADFEILSAARFSAAGILALQWY